MKLTRSALRKMILAEITSISSGSPEELAAQISAEHGNSLNSMMDAEVEDLVYTAMGEAGLMDDDWPDFLDATLDILDKQGAGQGQSVMGEPV